MVSLYRNLIILFRIYIVVDEIIKIDVYKIIKK